MRVQSVLKSNTQQRNKQNTAQNVGGTLTGSSTSGGSFQEYLNSYSPQKDIQKKAHSPEYKTNDLTLEAPVSESAMCESEPKHIDITG